MIFDITQEYIDRSVELHKEWGWPDGEFCPVALYLKDQFNTDIIEVGRHRILIDDNQYITPSNLVPFIINFDNCTIGEYHECVTPLYLEEELVEIIASNLEQDY